MTPILNRLALYKSFIIAWFVAKALELFFSGSTLDVDEETAITAELDAQLLAEQNP